MNGLDGGIDECKILNEVRLMNLELSRKRFNPGLH